LTFIASLHASGASLRAIAAVLNAQGRRFEYVRNLVAKTATIQTQAT
jgi:hypothetical protein